MYLSLRGWRNKVIALVLVTAAFTFVIRALFPIRNSVYSSKSQGENLAGGDNIPMSQETIMKDLDAALYTNPFIERFKIDFRYNRDYILDYNWRTYRLVYTVTNYPGKPWIQTYQISPYQIHAIAASNSKMEEFRPYSTNPFRPNSFQ